MKKLLFTFIFFISTVNSQQFDLECVGEGHTIDQNIKIIYEPNKKEVFRNGESLDNIFPDLKATQTLLSLNVDDHLIEFLYMYDMVDKYSETGRFASVHTHKINRATGLMEIRAKIVDDEDGILQKLSPTKMKCSKRQNEF